AECKPDVGEDPIRAMERAQARKAARSQRAHAQLRANIVSTDARLSCDQMLERVGVSFFANTATFRRARPCGVRTLQRSRSVLHSSPMACCRSETLIEAP